MEQLQEVLMNIKAPAGGEKRVLIDRILERFVDSSSPLPPPHPVIIY